MSRGDKDKKADKSAAMDRGESTVLMEPMLIAEGSGHRGALTDLAVDLAGRAAGFRRSLPTGIHSALAALVRVMDCYYSNLIEGHDTHPVDIERALKQDFSADARKRDLQEEARAHIAVQEWIDGRGLSGRAATADGLQEIHRRFCELLPDALLWVDDPESGERLRVEPGGLRGRDVKVGRHVPVSPGAVPRFLSRFEEAYTAGGTTDRILSVGPAHHRLLWIHPFLDGNGRVARLMSHAMLLDILDTGGVWSVARGLARADSAYKGHLAACDLERRNDLDGRGARSEEALAAFTTFFLETCIDQVRFMESLVQPDRFRERILSWAEEEQRLTGLPSRAGTVLEAILYRGELPRGDIPGLIGYSERQTRRVVSALMERDVVVAESTRAPLRLRFPAKVAPRWLPGLFPDKPVSED